MANFGNLSLLLAFAVTFYAIVMLVVGWRTRRRELVKSGEYAVYASCLLVTLASFALFYLFAVIFGIAMGGTNPLATVVTAELFGLKSLGVIFGSVMLVGTIGGALGATLAGVIFDLTASYQMAFLIGIAISVIAIGLSVALIRCKVKPAGA